MADIPSTIKGIAQAQAGINKLTDSLDKINNIKASPSIDAAAFNEASKYSKLLESLIESTKSLNAANEEFKKIQEENNDLLKINGKLTNEQTARLQKASDNAAVAAKQQKKYADEKSKADQNATKAELAINEAKVESWKKTTLAGKAYAAGTSQVAKMAAGFGVAATAMKVYGRFTDAARLRNNLMIASYRGINDNLAGATASTFQYEEAMRGAKATAIHLGMANEDVGGIMMKYQKIVGNAGPAAMGALTEATLATAKAMGIDSAEAISYVSAKMDNFGGTAQSALESLNDLRINTEKYNNSLAGVSIRGDEVVKTIQDITNSNNVYAVDQRFLATTLMRTSATLQANGESYNYAQKMANTYTKALSSAAPEWMQLINSFDIAKEVSGAWGKGADGVDKLTDEMSNKLEKAKPGLSKKVSDLMSNKEYSSYDKTRLLGEMLGDTDVGMTLMSKKIVDLGKSSITTLKNAYNVSYMEAEEMYKAALKTQEVEESTRILKEGTLEEQNDLKESMMETLDMSAAEIENALKNEDSKKRLLDLYADQNAIAESSATIEEQRTNAIQEQAKLKKKLNDQEANLAKLKGEGASSSAIKIAEAAAAETKTALDAQIAKVKQGEAGAKVGSTEDLKKMTEAEKEKQKPTAVLTGDFFAAKIEELSSPLGLLAAGSAAFFLTSTANQLLQNMFLAKIAGGSSATSAAIEVVKEVGLKVGLKGAAVATAGVVAAGIQGYESYNEYQDAKEAGASETDLSKLRNKGVAKTAGAGVGAGLGMWGGAAAGAAIGSAVPIVGTMIGGLIGGALGAWGGGALGAGAAGMAADKANTSIYGKTQAPSDRSREGLVKTTADQSIVQAKAVQQALQETSGTSGPSGTNPALTGGGPAGPLTGNAGNMNPDGSLNLVIQGFMPVVATAMADAKTRR